MSSPKRTDGEMLSLARQLLHMPPDSTNNGSDVPSSFLAELKKHISIFPDDTRFYIIRQLGTGYGFAVCQEDGCDNLAIPLSKSKDADGGKFVGIGSLNEYRTHVHDHPTHKSSRRARVQKAKQNRNRNSSTPSSPANINQSRLTLLSVQDNAITPRSLSTVASQSVPERIVGSINRGTVPIPSRLSNVNDTPAARTSLLREIFTEDETPGSANVLDITSPSSSRSVAMRAEDSLKRVRIETKIPLSPHDNNRTSGMSSIASASTSSTVSRFPLIEASIPFGLEMTAPGDASSSTYQPLALPAPPQMQASDDSMYDLLDDVSDVSGGRVFMEHFNPDHDFDEDGDDDYDVNGNWRGRGVDSFRGPISEAGDLQKFFQDAGNAEQFDDNASVAKGLERLGLPSLNTPFPDLAITLMPHQVIGVAWMLDKEKGVNKGGILSDEMGLGKTIQMIATMVANPSRDPAVKTTLIVAPLALLGQWKLEIETKTNDGLSVLIYHGQGKTKRKKELQKYDVVLTTFSTLALEWPDFEAEEKKKKKKKRGSDFIASDSEEESVVLKKKLGLLFTTSWYRIVLDEAQNIRNKRTRVSRAVTEAIATYRWCLTGTPITNSLGDAYPLIRFLQIRPWYDWNEFNEHIMKLEKRQPNYATKKLQAIFATCLLRRKKDTLLDGKRLVELPVKDVQLLRLEFTKDERDIYQMIESRSQQIFNRYLRAGTVLKNYAHVLVMLLRLRQICSHTSLITEQDGVTIDDNLEHSDEDRRDELIVAQTSLGREFVNKLRTKLKDIALERIAAELQSADAAVENEECPVCYDVFTDAVVTPCMHFFCRECINNVLAAPQTINMEHPHWDEHPCPSCRAPISRDKLFSREIFEPADEELNLAKSEPKTEEEESRALKMGSDEDEDMPEIGALLSARDGKNKQSKGKSRAKAGPKRLCKKRRILEDSDEMDEDSDLSDFIVHSDEDEEEKGARRTIKKRLGKRRACSPADYEESDDDSVIIGRKRPRSASVDNGPIKVLSKMLPSTKMMRMMESLLKWAEEHPDEKTMIISQWTQCLELVSNYLTSKEIGHVRFQGDMSREKRDKTIRIFMKKDDARVLLMSLKCGGVGLNLTRANRVISLDLGWSEAVESQAFDRVHRLGQTRPVVVERLVINNTVEDRVLALQEKKKTLADGSLGEGNGKKIGRLSVRELANLFGLDHRGHLLEG